LLLSNLATTPHNSMIDHCKQNLWASIEILKTALASMGAEDRTNAVVAMLGIVEAQLQGFVRGPSSSDAPDDNVGHVLHGHNPLNNDGVLGLATFGATTASMSPSDPPPGIVEVPASRYPTRTLDVSTPSAACDKDNNGEGHMFDGHNAPNNIGTISFTRTLDASTLTTLMSAGDEDKDADEGHMFNGHNAPDNDGVQGLSTDGLVMVASVALSHEWTVPNPGNRAPNIFDFVLGEHKQAKMTRMTKPKKKGTKPRLLRKRCAKFRKKGLHYCVKCDKFYCVDGRVGLDKEKPRYCMYSHICDAYWEGPWSAADPRFLQEFEAWTNYIVSCSGFCVGFLRL
jgi:hypothetical protein